MVGHEIAGGDYADEVFMDNPVFENYVASSAEPAMMTRVIKGSIRREPVALEAFVSYLSARAMGEEMPSISAAYSAALDKKATQRGIFEHEESAGEL